MVQTGGENWKQGRGCRTGKARTVLEDSKEANGLDSVKDRGWKGKRESKYDPEDFSLWCWATLLEQRDPQIQ